MFDWKVSAYGAGGAFVLSLLVGILSGNPFLVTLLRAVALGIGFGLIAAGIFALLRRFVPDLLSDEPAPTGVSFEPGSRPAPATPEGPVASAPEQPRLVDITLPAEEPEFTQAPGDDAEGTIASSFIPAGTAEESPSELAEEQPAAKTGIGSSDVADDVDVLPDLESLSDAFVVDSAPVQPEETASRDSGPKSRVPNDGPDPDTLASAIRTMLKKD